MTDVSTVEPQRTHAIVHYSGGLSSHLAAKRMVEEYGAENVTLLFCDTKSEDPDLYRFVHEGAESLGAYLVILREGRNIWEVMRDERYLANTRVDPCSRTLKRRPAAAWIRANHTPQSAVQVFGYAECEKKRWQRTINTLPDWQIRAPLCETPSVRSSEVREEFARECPNLKPPRLYALGAPHNNCGGLCVKAGQKHFAWGLKVIPELYAIWEQQEARLRAQLGNVSILRDRRGGGTKPLPLSEFRKRMAAGKLPASEDDHSCNCYVPQEED